MDSLVLIVTVVVGADTGLPKAVGEARRPCRRRWKWLHSILEGSALKLYDTSENWRVSSMVLL